MPMDHMAVSVQRAENRVVSIAVPSHCPGRQWCRAELRGRTLAKECPCIRKRFLLMHHKTKLIHLREK